MANQTLLKASTMNTIRTNASTLWENGYKVELIAGDGLFRVFNPAKGCSYVVETRGGKSCECICFQKYGMCKHCEGLVFLIQCQMSSYYTRHQVIAQELKRSRGTMDQEAYKRAYAQRLDDAAWELECALGDLTGKDEFLMGQRLVGYMPEIGEKAPRNLRSEVTA